MTLKTGRYKMENTRSKNTDRNDKGRRK